MKRILYFLPLFILLATALFSCDQRDEIPSEKADFSHLGLLSVVIGEQSFPVLANGLIDLGSAQNVVLTGSEYNTNTHTATLSYSLMEATPVVCTVKTTNQDLLIRTSTSTLGSQQTQIIQIGKANTLGTITYYFKQKVAQK